MTYKFKRFLAHVFNGVHAPTVVVNSAVKSFKFTVLYGLVLWLTFNFSNLKGIDVWPISPSLNDFCEEIDIHSVVRQPVNSWTNLIYFFVGMWLFFIGAHDQNAREGRWLRRFPVFTYIFALGIGGLGLTSFLYHSLGWSIFQQLDLWNVIVVAYLPFWYFFFKYFKHPFLYKYFQEYKQAIIFGYFGFSFFLFPMELVTRWNATAGIFLSIFALYSDGIVNKIHFDNHWLGNIAVSLFGLAMGVWLIDYYDVFCNPDSLFQLHAVWHVLTALGLAFLYLHIRKHD